LQVGESARIFMDGFALERTCGMAWNLIFYEIVRTANFEFIQDCTAAKSIILFVSSHHQYDAMTIYFLYTVMHY
jgi:hypothetical protein